MAENIQAHISILKEHATKISKLLMNTKKSAKSKITKGYLDTRLETLMSYWSTYTKSHDYLIATSTKEAMRLLEFNAEDNYDRTEECYMELKSLIKDYIYEYQKLETTHTDTVSHNEPKLKPKLPPINIPTFSGDYNQWMSFRDLFVSLIHTDDSLTKIEKHHYLRASLTGEAEMLVRNFSLTEADYDDAWQKLKDRYENKRVIVNNILSRLLNQKKLTSESSKGIKDLLDTTSQCLNSLKNLKIETTSWDAIIVYLVVSKLDMDSHKLWEQSLESSTEIPTYTELALFLEKRFRSMEIINIAQVKESQRKESSRLPLVSITPKPINIKSHSTELETNCTYCSHNHYICHCKDFASLTVADRQDFVKKNRICFNCLVKGHSVDSCRQSTCCKKCGRRHHTLLHYTNPNKIKPPVELQIKENTNTINTASTSSCNLSVNLKTETSENDQVILATAEIAVESKIGNTYKLRALVDQGSQGSFISEAASQLLKLDRIPVIGKISGISNTSVVTTRSMVTLTIHTKDYLTKFKVNAYVLKKLTSLLPSREFPQDTWPSDLQLNLADSNFHKPGSIDVLLGADVHAQIILEGLHKYKSLIALNSRLGWLISGKVTQTDVQERNMVVSHTKIEVDQLIRQFWEIEENIPHKKPMTELETQCEEHFKNTHTRTDDGRYIVRLPFRDDFPELGNTKQLAVRRLQQMEKRFTHNADFKADYEKFMQQYESDGHMMKIPEREEVKQNSYYLPHHAVLRPTSLSTKLRVVFDGSAAPENGRSINEELLTGYPLQQNITDLIIRWRQHKICLLADIQKMYRQILIAKEDVDYQRIVWRESSLKPINEYRLLTVTYGTACAPFLAIRTIHQLANDESSDYPVESEILKTDLYMDDLMTGASTEEDAIYLQNRLTQLLARGGFLLHKWASNSELVLSQIPDSSRESKGAVIIKIDDTVKTLGITWNSHTDNFELNLVLNSNHSNWTKRNVLSSIAKTFDPLGWLAPSIISLKIFMQNLWLAGLEWDEVLPENLLNEWNTYLNEFQHIESIQLPRWFGVSGHTTRLELHGFSDASCLAYAGVVYLRVWDGDGNVNVHLVMAKSRVAPVRQVSLPRLELCGAVLLVKLIEHIKTTLKIKDENVYAWTDSTIVLAWLRKHPRTWTTFVANRTSEILTVTNSNQWHYIDSANNPADLPSRGVYPKDLKQSQLWWKGPKFLHENLEFKHSETVISDTILESRTKISTNVNITICKEADSHLKRFSSLSKLVRVTAYCLRFIKLCRVRVLKQSVTQPTYLTSLELKDALNVCIRISQSITFYDELNLLAENKRVHKTSKIYVLDPYLDETQIIRVGGRLANAEISNNMKYPVVLSHDCTLAKLIVSHAHVKTLHGGHQLTLNYIRQSYWIIRAKSLIKSILKKCIPCFKQRATPVVPFMGNLPTSRVKPSRAFLTSGVDFAGPVSLKLYPGRCKRMCKSYICLFICTVTKAIHLELVTDLTSASFIAAFRRFVARRGHCKEIWSDRGTNFVGASRELNLAYKNSKSQTVAEISELLANDHTTWNFIPPGSPHFGGLWESGVKSVKGHLKRVIGQTSLTFEEFTTVLTQVEACVNSRPLSLISSSIDEPPLTPGHFLIGEPLIGVPEQSLIDTNISPLNRWHMLQRMVQCLWQRWHCEYLTTLQQRYKWNKHCADIELGTIVLVKDERLPPGKWLLGRVIQKHPGADGITRVVSLQYKTKVFKRPLAKLCPLPLEVPDSA